MKKLLKAALALALVGAAASGCGSTDATTSSDTAVAAAATTEAENGSVSKAELDRAVDEAVAKAKAKAKAAKAKAKREKAAAKVDDVIEDAEQGQSDDQRSVPNVSGMDHQLAQDTLQAAGFYMLEEVDCSGQDRMMLWDRNWTVETQKPAAGSQASLDATITLCAVKDGE